MKFFLALTILVIFVVGTVFYQLVFTSNPSTTSDENNSAQSNTITPNPSLISQPTAKLLPAPKIRHQDDDDRRERSRFNDD